MTALLLSPEIPVEVAIELLAEGVDTLLLGETVFILFITCVFKTRL